jgi:hypothetical protein
MQTSLMDEPHDRVARVGDRLLVAFGDVDEAIDRQDDRSRIVSRFTEQPAILFLRARDDGGRLRRGQQQGQTALGAERQRRGPDSHQKHWRVRPLHRLG